MTTAGKRRADARVGDEAVILVEGLRKSFGPVVALDGVDLVVPRGSVLGLLGPNAAGKTTLVRILTTLHPPDSGRAEVAGCDVVREAARLRATIGLAGQQVALDDHLTGEENLEMVGASTTSGAARYAGGPRRCWRASTSARPRQGPHRRTRAGCASASTWPRAWSAGPRCSSWTSPPTGIDPKSRMDLWEVIRGLVADGTTLLLTTQYLEEADHLADAIAVVNDGRVVAYRTAGELELKARIGEEVLEVTLAHGADAPRALEALRAFGASEPEVDDAGLRVGVYMRGDGANPTDVVRRLDRAGVVVLDMARHQPTLDDVFIALTSRPAEQRPAEEPSVRTCGAAAVLRSPPGMSVGGAGTTARQRRPRLRRGPLWPGNALRSAVSRRSAKQCRISSSSANATSCVTCASRTCW